MRGSNLISTACTDNGVVIRLRQAVSGRAMTSGIDDVRDETERDVRAPAFMLEELSSIAGVSRSTTTGWTKRWASLFDASGPARRRYSRLDAVKVALAAALVEQHVPRERAMAAAHALAEQHFVGGWAMTPGHDATPLYLDLRGGAEVRIFGPSQVGKSERALVAIWPWRVLRHVWKAFEERDEE